MSFVDVVGALTDQPTPKRASTYWSVLKTRLKEEGAEELLTNCKRLKMLSADGKHHPTDVADIQTIFRIIQSVPSTKAEPFKQWMARVASDRVDEMQDPELAMKTWGTKKGPNYRSFFVCPERESNPHIFKGYWILSPARLPIPPSGQCWRLTDRKFNEFPQKNNYLCRLGICKNIYEQYQEVISLRFRLPGGVDIGCTGRKRIKRTGS